MSTEILRANETARETSLTVRYVYSGGSPLQRDSAKIPVRCIYSSRSDSLTRSTLLSFAQRKFVSISFSFSQVTVDKRDKLIKLIQQQWQNSLRYGSPNWSKKANARFVECIQSNQFRFHSHKTDRRHECTFRVYFAIQFHSYDTRLRGNEQPGRPFSTSRDRPGAKRKKKRREQ